ncbi:MAG TPA: zf-HC2 domain-containing protein [Kofleriaceae bacterium]|nr:zf-HC2 domain-containing protein [Kofleriaceae bacterium]
MDELMMDWLYDELDPSSSARVAEHVDGCARCSAEVGALRRTRAAFRDLSDVEPPPAVSAILLHEAALRSPATAAAAPPRAADSPPIWIRLRDWLRPLALHPAATAMATLLLVAGVAGALYVRRGWNIGSPMQVPAASDGNSSARSSAAATPAPDAPEPPPPGAPQYDMSVAAATGAGEGRIEAENAPPAKTPDNTPDNTVDQFAHRGDAPAAALLEGDGEAQLRAATGAKDARKKIARRQPSAGEKMKEPADDLGGDKGLADGDQVKQRGLEPAKPDSAPTVQEGAVGGAGAAGPGAASPSTTIASEDRGRLSRAKKTSPPPADAKAKPSGERALTKEERGWLDLQEQKLAALARDKRCRAAAAIANDILDRNPDFYARRVRDSKLVAPCRSYVNGEQRRRAAMRAKSPPAAASKAGAEPAKTVPAAPARDEAAEKSAN